MQNHIWSWSLICPGIEFIYSLANRELETNNFFVATYLYNFILERALFSDRIQKCIVPSNLSDNIIFKLVLAKVQLLAMGGAFSSQSFVLDEYLKKFPKENFVVQGKQIATSKLLAFVSRIQDASKIQITDLSEKNPVPFAKQNSLNIDFARPAILKRPQQNHSFMMMLVGDRADVYNLAKGPRAFDAPAFSIKEPFNISKDTKLSFCPTLDAKEFLVLRILDSREGDEIFRVTYDELTSVKVEKIARRIFDSRTGKDLENKALLYCERVDGQFLIFERLGFLPNQSSDHAVTSIRTGKEPQSILESQDPIKFETLFSEALNVRDGPIVDGSHSFVYEGSVFSPDPDIKTQDLILAEEDLRWDAFRKLSRDTRLFVQISELPSVGMIIRTCSISDCGAQIGIGISPNSDLKISPGELNIDPHRDYRIFFEPITVRGAECPGGILNGLIETLQKRDSVYGAEHMIAMTLCLDFQGKTKKSKVNRVQEILFRESSPKKEGVGFKFYVKKGEGTSASSFVFHNSPFNLFSKVGNFSFQIPAVPMGAPQQKNESVKAAQKMREDFLEYLNKS